MAYAIRTPPLRVALAGRRMISRHHLLGCRRSAIGSRLVAVCDPHEGHARHRAEEFGIPKVYTDRDAMLAGGGDRRARHRFAARDPRRLGEDAALRGIDVICQKPLTPTLAERSKLVRSVDGRVRLMVHENWRFARWYRELKSWSTRRRAQPLVTAACVPIGSTATHRPRRSVLQHDALLSPLRC